MTVFSWLSQAEIMLRKNNIQSARLDCLMMLEFVRGQNRANILAGQDLMLKNHQLLSLNKLLKKRASHYPMAYLLNNKEFYGRQFFVNESVLIPRPESEAFIDLLKKHQTDIKNLVDVGTGSGCLAISAKLELPDITVEACDIMPGSLKIAQKNADNLQADIHFFKSDLLLNTSKRYDGVFANLPYVPKSLLVEKDLSYEPQSALFAEQNGLSLIKRLIASLPKKLNSNGLFFCESLKIQHAEVADFAKGMNLTLINTEGLVQLFKNNN